MAERSMTSYIARTTIELFIFAIMFPVIYTALVAMNQTATIISLSLLLYVVFFLGVVWKVLKGAGLG